MVVVLFLLGGDGDDNGDVGACGVNDDLDGVVRDGGSVVDVSTGDGEVTMIVLMVMVLLVTVMVLVVVVMK